MKQNEIFENGIDTSALELDNLGRIVIRDGALLNEIVGAGEQASTQADRVNVICPGGGTDPNDTNIICR